MRAWLGTSVGLLMLLAFAASGRAQSTDSTSRPLQTVVPGQDRFDAQQDPFTVETADGLGLAGGQRKVFFDNVQAVVHDALIINPGGGRGVIDSSIAIVARETEKKIKFIRQARVLFGEMYARRKGDANRVQATEDELWRSPRNVSGLIELYRRNPNAQDFEIERAMAPAFTIPH